MSIIFLHLSDLHLVPPGRALASVEPMQQLQDVLRRIKRLEVSPTFVVVSGDLTDDGAPESYEIVAGVLQELGSQGMPVLLALGNHDDRAMFRRVLLGEKGAADQTPYFHSQVIDGLRVIVLDSTLPGEDGGALGAGQLAWLEEELQLPAPEGNLIVLHHPCRLAAPERHYPAFILHDAAELEAIVARYRDRIVGVLAGHSHQANSAPFGGTLHATAPAVLCQLDFFGAEEYMLVPGSGFNLCELDDDGLVVHPIFV